MVIRYPRKKLPYETCEMHKISFVYFFFLIISMQKIESSETIIEHCIVR